MELNIQPVIFNPTKKIDREILYYMFRTQFIMDSLLVNLKILSSSKYYDETLFDKKEKEYYELFIEYNILFNFILYANFRKEFIEMGNVMFTYDITQSTMSVKKHNPNTGITEKPSRSR